jgi:nucleoid-associated protein YgaU
MTENPDFSNVSGGVSNTTGSTSQTQTYTVQSGDSLSKIAKHFYGDANQWNRIFEANRDTVKDANKIQPGQTLTIPQ